MRTRVLAAAALAVLALTGCAVQLPLGPPAAPVPAPSATPGTTEAAPSEPPPSEPAPTPAGPLAVADGACTDLLLEAVAAAPEEPFEDGFLRPELVEGLEVGCSATQQTPDNEAVRSFSFALVRAGEGTIATIDERILATSGLVRGDPSLPYYVDERQATWAYLYSGLVWQDLEGAGPFDDAEAWLLLRWYEPR